MIMYFIFGFFLFLLCFAAGIHKAKYYDADDEDERMTTLYISLMIGSCFWACWIILVPVVLIMIVAYLLVLAGMKIVNHEPKAVKNQGEK